MIAPSTLDGTAIEAALLEAIVDDRIVDRGVHAVDWLRPRGSGPRSVQEENPTIGVEIPTGPPG